MNKGFSEWLRDALDKAGMRPADLWRKTGVTKQNISKLLHQHPPSQPTVETVDKIAKGLGADPSEARLAAGYAPISLTANRPPPTTRQELLERFEELGIYNPTFYQDHLIDTATPEQLQELVDAVSLAIEITLRKELKNGSPPTIPPNDADVHNSRG